MICNRCANENPDGANYCMVCGETMGAAIQTKPTTHRETQPTIEQKEKFTCKNTGDFTSLMLYFLAIAILFMSIALTIAGYNTWEDYGSGWDKAHTVLTCLVEGLSFAGILAGLGYITSRK